MKDYELPQVKFYGNLVIIGTGSNSSIMSYLFENSSNLHIVGYSEHNVENFVYRDKVVYPLEHLETYHDPTKEHNYVFVAVGDNKIRSEIYNDLKDRRYKFASFVSSKAVVYDNVKIGDNIFIFENNVVQYKCEIGNNTILWSGNHIGHETIVGDDVFISSHCVVSGYCNIGNGSFLGVNCTIVDNVNIPENSFVKANSLIAGDTYVEKIR